MKFLKLTTTDPYYNLAVEEYLLTHTSEDVFMLWQNSPTVVIGKNQNAYAEVDLKFAEENGIMVARRITGGGAVYHDLGNINYSYITSSNGSLDFARLSRPIISALGKLGITAELGGRNDILIGDKKISGNAQHTSNGRTLHHGTLLFDVDTDTMSRVLRVDKEKLDHHGVKSHKSRVANIKELLPQGTTSADFLSALESFIIKELNAQTVTVEDSAEISALEERNKSREWILSSKRFLTDYNLKKKKRYPYGSVEVSLSLEGDIIKSISINGDFFSLSPIESLEAKLVGKRLTDKNIPDVSKYIASMTNEEFFALLNE